MNYRLMVILNVVVAAAAGVALVVAPQPFLQFFGVTDAYTSTLLIARFFGGALIVTAVLLWFLKDSTKELVKTEALTMMVASAAGAVLVVIDLVSKKGVLRSNGWIPLLIYLLLAAGYAYTIFGVTVKVKGKSKK
jgi:hypothetical protein